LEPRHLQRIDEILRRALDRTREPAARASLLRGLCLTQIATPEQGLRWVLEAALLDGGRGSVVEFLKHQKVPMPRQAYARAVDEVLAARATANRGSDGANASPNVSAGDGDPALREQLLALHDQAVQPASGYAQVLARNLRLAVELCRRHGAEPVLLDYPA